MNHLLSHFQLTGTVLSAKPLGSGHINDSYRVSMDGDIDYLLQRINHEVFPDVAGMMRNIDLVTSHLRDKMIGSGQRTLTVIPAKSGALFLQDEVGNSWRVYEFLTDLEGFDLLDTPEQAYEGARAYGHFLRFLDDFPAEQIVDVIPDFHNISSRLKAFASSVKADVVGRGRRCKEEIKSIESLANRLTTIQRSWDAGQLPTRTTHNDTKFNNVLFDGDGIGRAVVDLDTVMQGVVHFDFGDGVRTGAATAPEDEADLHLVGVDPAKYQAFQEGYLEITQDYLTPLELELLPLAGPLLAYLMAVRFLTDFLNGDVYYKTAYPDHNLVRGRNQLKLVEELLKLT
jgi:Ser/Thr protein kinase RdoA (MazF antagonist)